jgi:hypothetical protein
MRFHLTRGVLGGAFVAVSVCGPAQAADNEDVYDGNWHFSITPYIWAPGFEGDFDFAVPPSANGNPEVEAGPTDILEALDFAFMGYGDARKGPWSVFADFMYVDLSDDESRVRTITGPGGIIEIPINVRTEVGLEASVFTFGGAYTVYRAGGFSMDAFLGARYLDTDVSLSWQFANPPLFLPQTGSLDQSSEIFDAIIGVKGRYRFAENWFVPYYLDIGTGDSEITWQALAGVGYAFDWGDVSLNYRYLSYQPEGQFVDDLNLYGLAAGVTFHF